MRDAFDYYFWSQRKLTVHGSAVEIACACDELVPQLDHLAQPFREADFPDGFVPLRGTIEPYCLEDVLKHLSTKAVRLPGENQTFDLYRDGDRYFRVDERVGLVLVDLIRRRWHSWITPEALEGDAVRVTDAAVVWPLAQLLALRGLRLIPAASVVRDGFGVLLLGDLPLEPELTALLGAGYRLIGQRWVALREDAGRIEMLHLPGHVQRKSVPRGPQRIGRFKEDHWTDLHADHPHAIQNQGFCDLVLVCGAGRRAQIGVRPVGWTGAMNVLRRAWPSTDLPHQRRGGKLVAKLASLARVAELQLSRDPRELVSLLENWSTTREKMNAITAPIALAKPQAAPVTAQVGSSVVGWTRTRVSLPVAKSA